MNGSGIAVDPATERIEVPGASLLGDRAEGARILSCSGTETVRASVSWWSGGSHRKIAWSPLVRTWAKLPAFTCVDCSYSVNADYNAAKNIARKLALKLQRGQKSPAGGAFCQYALKPGVMTVNTTNVASDTYVSAERESPGKPTASAVGS